MFQITHEESQQPHRDFHGCKDSHDNVVVTFIKGFTPISQEVDYSSRSIWVICGRESKVYHLYQSMGAGGPRDSILVWVKIFLNVVK